MSIVHSFPALRLRRLRASSVLRDLVSETRLDIKKLIQPIFIKANIDKKIPIQSMPTQFQWSLNDLPEFISDIQKSGITSVLLFGIPEHKDPLGQDAYSDQGIVQKAIRLIKKQAPELLVIADLCFCEYTSHGHCGVVHQVDENHFEVDNDATLDLLSKQAISLVKAGADIIAPSGNMDGMVGAIRKGLDSENYSTIPILSYAVKYASSLYGPFREASEGAPQFGDRRSYQMDVRNGREALRECALDVSEGADMLMVKPAHAYLDIIYRVKQQFPEIPLGAYHVSGEFSMLKVLGGEKKWIDEKKSVLEILTAIHRAGADFIITYYAKEVAEWLG